MLRRSKQAAHVRSSAKKAPRVTRRSILEWAVAGSAAFAARPLYALAATSANSSIAATTAGRVRGLIRQGVHVFKGIPYGASTAGRNRFMPPQKPAAWSGVRDTLSYGPMAMQAVRSPLGGSRPTLAGSLYEGGMDPWAHQVSEDCLVLNVWTPALEDGVKRPVMLWCHGGGYSGLVGDADWFDGNRLACKHDVVVVSSNHRLNVFGYLYLASLGEERYAKSSNVGMLDIVAVLEWIRHNITSFGGDPGNVTVFGESGGGYKVSTLLAMPAAKGLFHKAIVQSGSQLRAMPHEEATRVTHAVLAQLQLAPSQLDRLQQLPAKDLVKAANDIGRGGAAGFQPVVDGRSLPQHPFDPDAPQISAHVPMLIGTTQDDSIGVLRSLPAESDWAGMHVQLKRQLGIDEDRARKVIEAYRATRRNASPNDIFAAVATDVLIRSKAILQAERKSAQSVAPAFMYLFAWPAPGAQYKAMHQVEVPFVFDNLDKAPGFQGATPDPHANALAEKTSAAWVAFARTGNPNHAGLPQWPPYTVKDRATMVLNTACELVHDPGREDRLAWTRN